MSVWRSRFFWKVYAAFSLLFLTMTLIVSWTVFDRVRSSIRAGLRENLRDKVEFLSPYVEDELANGRDPSAQLIQRLGTSSGSRITVIAIDGKVLTDSEALPASLENHLHRPEIEQALAEPFGFATRHSDSINQDMYYFAKSIKRDGRLLGFVRVSLSTANVDRELATLQLTIIGIAALGVIVALALGWSLARRVTIPLSEMVRVAEALRNGHYEAKVTPVGSDEIGRLGDTLNRLGTELTSKINDLQRLENVRRDFVANVSHEIKTPLTSIKGYVETLLGGALNDPANNIRFLEKIDRNAQRLTALVQDLLSLAKIEASEDTFRPTPVEWNAIIASVVARHEDAIQQKNLKIKINTPAQILSVMGEREAMTQVLDNLLTNAVKYTTDGGRITVSLFAKSGFAKLVVEDTGIGIPSEHLDRIFERFYRVDKARSRDLGGTGLGLSIVKHLVSAMHGDVGVESELGVGSKFTVRLRLTS